MKCFSIISGVVLVLPQLVKYIFNHNYLLDKNFLHCSWSNSSSIVAVHVLLISLLDKYIFIAGGQLVIPWQLVNYFFHWSGSATSSIAAGQLLLPLVMVSYFFHCSWSTTSSIGAGQILLPSEPVNYFFHCSWSTTSSIAAGQLLLPLQLVNYFFHCR